jgi:hypothetical protein
MLAGREQRVLAGAACWLLGHYPVDVMCTSRDFKLGHLASRSGCRGCMWVAEDRDCAVPAPVTFSVEQTLKLQRARWPLQHMSP